MVEYFPTQFQVETNMPAVLVMQSSTHFREVLNEMLQVRTEGESEGKATEGSTSPPRLPPIYLTDEECKACGIKENENSSKNIGKFPPSSNTEIFNFNHAEMTKQNSQEDDEKETTKYLKVPIEELDSRATVLAIKEPQHIISDK
jgi:hypothetical protein